MMDKYQNRGFNKYLNKIRAKKILQYAKGTRCIELGCGEGQITKHLAKRYDYLVAVDQDEIYLNKVTTKALRIHSKIENLPKDFLSYDYIICSNLLEHVTDPTNLVKYIKTFGDKDSIFFFSVPNANSINRVLGKDIGMLNKTTEVTTCDAEAGHKRMFTLTTFLKLINTTFKIEEYGTYFYKPFNNDKMKKLPKKFIKICEGYKMGEHGAEIYVVAELK